MSEYNKFLNYFNKSKKDGEEADSSEREDMIPVKGAVRSTEEVNEEKTETSAVSENKEADKTEEIRLPEKEAEEEEKDEINTDTIKKSRFIKSNDAQFIAVNSENRKEIPTQSKKYTDRLLPQVPQRKIQESKKEKGSSYDDMHAPSPETKLFRPANEDEDMKLSRSDKKQQTPKNTAAAQTKIIPTVIKDTDETPEENNVIVEKNPSSDTLKTKDLSEKGRLLRQIATTSGQENPEDDGQLIMEGFIEEDNSALPDITKEEKDLEELSKVREKRIKSFRFWTKSAVETGESEDKSFSPQREEPALPAFLSAIRDKFSHLDTDFVPMGDEEYKDPSRRKEIFSSLMGLKKSSLIKALFLTILGAVLLIINMTTAVSAAMHNGFFTVLGGSAVAYNIINLVFLLLCGAVMADDLKKGFLSVLKIRPKTDTALLVMYLGALAQVIASFFTTLKTEGDYHLISGAVILLSVPVLLSKALYYDSTRHCFKAVGTTSDKCYLRKISDKETISQLLKDKNPTETNVVYAGKTRFISGFLKRSAGAAFSGQASSRLIVLTSFGALVAGIIGLIVTKSPVYALGCFTVTAALSFPVSCLLFTGYMISSENSMLSLKASFIGTYSDAYSFTCIDDIYLNGDEVLRAEIVSSATASNVSQKQAEFCAAVLTNKAGGILKDAFSVFSQGLQDRYPEVDGLVFEEKLGLSAWISDCRVLLGNKQFLLNHNVDFPEAHTIPFIMDENTKPLFLAIEGHFAAAFSVKYSCDSMTAKSLGSLASSGANILLGIKDPNITASFGEEILGLPADSLRIVTDTNNLKFNEQKNTVTDMEDTGIVFSDSFEAFSKTLAGAIKLEKIRKTAKLLAEVASVSGMLLGLIFCATGSLTFINGWPVAVLQLCWILFSFLLTPSLSSTKLKKKIHLPEESRRRSPVFPEDDGDLPDFREDFSPVKKEEKEEAEEEPQEKAEEEDEDSIFDDSPINTKDRPNASVIKNRLKNMFSRGEEEEEEPGEPEQLIMEGAPYTKPPQVVDIDALQKEKEKEEEEKEKEKEKENADEPKREITDDILDSFAESTPKRKAVSSSSRKKGLFRKASEEPEAEEEPEEIKPRIIKSVFSILDEKLPVPPKFDLSKKEGDEKEEEEDPLNAKFVPPSTENFQSYYRDDFFSSFDTAEDDKAFEAVRRNRDKRESTADEFDFWTKK